MSGLASLELGVARDFCRWWFCDRVYLLRFVFCKLEVTLCSCVWLLANPETPFKVMFAAFASILVTTYAIYAKHSGIPEIKTVLGGFVIRRFMGTWTLVIKSLGLVSLDRCVKTIANVADAVLL